MPALTIPDPRGALPPGCADTRPVARVVQIIAEAARAQRPCPTNEALAATLGYGSTSSVARLVRKAELAGLIHVQRGQRDRVVSARDGRWRTAGAVTTPHWREDAGRVA